MKTLRTHHAEAPWGSKWTEMEPERKTHFETRTREGDFAEILELPDGTQYRIYNGVNELAEFCHLVALPWWYSYITGNPLRRNPAELLALIHSEISEALEGLRTNARDSHLPQYKSVHVELCDAVIRIMDYLGAENAPVAQILIDKLHYNLSREDHTHEVRLQPEGKSI